MEVILEISEVQHYFPIAWSCMGSVERTICVQPLYLIQRKLSEFSLVDRFVWSMVYETYIRLTINIKTGKSKLYIFKLTYIYIIGL